MNWRDDTTWEREWWGNCTNTFGEEYKQFAYARRMGITFFYNGKSPFNINLKGKSIVDIGGGPSSLLLKCVNTKSCIVVDPCDYPAWVEQRYNIAGIELIKVKAEDFSTDNIFDEVWIYNVLQHVENPELVIRRGLAITKVLRIFEWIDTEPTPGHPHKLNEYQLNEWLSGEGKVEMMDENTARGKCYYGIFKGDKYQEL